MAPSSGGRTPFARLPPECAVGCLAILQFEDLRAVASCCKAWRALRASAPFIVARKVVDESDAAIVPMALRPLGGLFSSGGAAARAPARNCSFAACHTSSASSAADPTVFERVPTVAPKEVRSASRKEVKATGADAAKPIGDEWLPERLRTKPEKPANQAARKAAAAATLREAAAERPRARAERKERQKALDVAARREARAIAKKAPKPRREAPPAPPPRPATWAEFAFPAEGDVLEFCELCGWLFECFVCMAGFANLQTFAIYPLYSTAFATALIKGVECFVIGKFAPPPPAPDAADERDASPPPRRRTLSSGSHGSPKRNRKGSR